MWCFFVCCALLGLVNADNGTNIEAPVFTCVDTNQTVGVDCKNCTSKCCPETQIYINNTCVDKVYTDNGKNFEGPVFTYVGTNQTVGEDCKDCTSKCCPGTQIYINDTCVDNVFGVKKLEDMHVDIYNNDIAKTDFTLKKFTFVTSDVFNGIDSGPLDPGKGETLYMLENGKYYLRRANYLQQWGIPIPYQRICTEVKVSTHPDGSPILGTEELVYREVYGEFIIDVNGDRKDQVAAGAMLLSCFFLLLVLAAFAVLPQKRNLPSLMLMAYVACLATAFLLIPVQVFTKGQIEKSTCVPLGLTVYYSFLAGFTWLNVMSYDMWSTTCKSQMPRWEPRRKILAKFGWYSLYGFGAPLLTTLFLVGIDYPDLSSVPDFIQPHYVFGSQNSCTFETEHERNLYVHGPMLVATVLNIIFCVMTGLYIRRNSSKPGGTGESRNTKRDQSRFIIYVKLTLIMGVNWVLDVASAFISPKSEVWYVSDVFNSLVGLFIFIIFVCKKDMFLMLCKRFSIKTTFARQWESTVETSVSVSKRQLSDKEAGSTNMLPDGFSEKPNFYNNNIQGRY